MLHFFRRIRQALLKDNKYRKYAIYALGEIALVMIGILLALQVNNWNEERKRKAEEMIILNDLYKEVKTNHERFREFHSLKKQVKDEWEKYLNIVSNLTIPEAQRAIKRPNNGAFDFNPSESVMNSILSSGKLDIITNDSLKYELSNWDNVIGEFNHIQSRHVNHVEGALRDYESKNRLIKDYNGPGSGWAFENPFYKNYTSAELISGQLSINNDLENQNIMLLNYMWIRLILARSESLDQQFSKLTLLIQEELQNR